VEVDAFNLVVVGILLQYDNDGNLQPVTYFSRKHFTVEINYEIYDKKLFTIICTFKEWRYHLEGCPHNIEIILTHQNLTYFATNCLLNYCQSGWSEFFPSFNFIIDCGLGKAHVKDDILTYQGQKPKDESDIQEAYQSQTLLNSDSLDLLVDILYPNGGFTFHDLILTLYEVDPFPLEVL
jgi:hypothetical protein